MATPIPGFASQIFSSGETASVNGGSPAALETTRYYYLVSNRTALTDGQSLLKALKDMLDAALAGTVWTVTLVLSGGLYKIKLVHNNGSARTVALSASFATALGFSAASFSVPTGASGVTASYPSYWWWSPDMPISASDEFDPAISYGGTIESAGFSQRAPDGTTAYGQNGVLYSARIGFSKVTYYYKVRAQSGHTNEDLETWWKRGPAQGRRFLMWRDRDNATGSNAPSEGTATPYNYVEYAPTEVLRGKQPWKQAIPDNLVYWDVSFDCWLTENGETPLSD